MIKTIKSWLSRLGVANWAGPGSPEDFKRTVGDTVYFKQGTTQFGPGDGVLFDQIAWLRQYPERHIVIEGHTADNEGSREECIHLGELRAAEVKEVYTNRSVDASRIQIISFGKEHPTCNTTDDECRGQNRRVVVVILGD
jgi:peptidoglycan-associated lipoprotein